MKLQYLIGNECPTCGCNTVISESVEKSIDGLHHREHCSGGKWETREFSCGCKLEYIPNYGKTVVNEHRVCTNNHEYIIREKNREVFKNEVKTFISNYESSDESFKNKLLERFNYI